MIYTAKLGVPFMGLYRHEWVNQMNQDEPGELSQQFCYDDTV